VRLTTLCALGAAITAFALAGCSDSLEPGSIEQPAQFQLANLWNGRGTITICHVVRWAGKTKYFPLTLPIRAVYGRGGHLNENGTPLRGHEQDFIVTSTNLCPPAPTPVTTGTLYICKIAGAGVTVGSAFSFTVNGTPIRATATTDASSNLSSTVCANAGTFPVGTTVVIRETIPPGFHIQTEAFNHGNGAELISFDQAPGSQDYIGMTVTTGEGPQFGVVTNAAN
jgi:hypothetical protein